MAGHSLGAHVSIAGGASRALPRGEGIGCTAVQIFTRNQMQWRAPELPEEEVQRFRAAREASVIGPVVVHDSYLINLASTDPVTLQRSRDAFDEEIRRCELLGIDELVFHPGAHMEAGDEAGIARIAESLNLALAARPDTGVNMLLETTAGQGSNVGWRFEHLAGIIQQVEKDDRLGVCIDTCHIFAAGYDIRTGAAFDQTMSQFDAIVGLDRVRALHLNDSKRPLSSRVDRHDNLGWGEIGLEAFGHFIHFPRFRGLPMIVETPGGVEQHRADLEKLWELAGTDCPSQG